MGRGLKLNPNRGQCLNLQECSRWPKYMLGWYNCSSEFRRNLGQMIQLPITTKIRSTGEPNYRQHTREKTKVNSNGNEFRRGSAIFKSDNLSTITIIRDIITADTTKRDLRVDVTCGA